MTTRASFRILRTGVIGSLILGLAAGGHFAGGGRLPEPAILAALCALTVLPVAVLTRFRLSMPVLTALLGAGQAWLHWAFHALSDGAAPGAPVLTGHAGHAPVSLPPEAFGTVAPTHADPIEWQMFAAHAVATLVTALVLARGELALSALAAWLRPLVQLPAAPSLQPPRLPGPCPVPAVLPVDRAGRRLPARRGPPAMASAA
ncbi:hypothetical protein [Arthrobacter sp. AZCC_0090]|uniref:hypothetical protein n=1 Tax=Arthrobacter sp. AZCC_0090 TaxID=2735881 RepID=UPI001616F06A|nr:hypothetical protein [Arthrobacter sp. AZCC_0090]MBB6404769.1 hypothetical protein [Arthrobacter sp. AZCC_0090]